MPTKLTSSEPRNLDVYVGSITLNADGSVSLPTTITVDGTSTSAVTARTLIQSIVVEGTPGASYSIGVTAGGDEIGDDTIPDSGFETLVINRWFQTAATLHFTGTFTATYKPQ